MTASTTQTARRQRLLSELPDGLMDEAEAIWAEVSSGLQHWQLQHQQKSAGSPCDVSSKRRPTKALVDELFAPIERDSDWPEPSRPHPVGQGWVHWDTIEDDEPLLAAMADRWAGLEARQVAVEAQALRLPVVDYRPQPTVHRTQSRLSRRTDRQRAVANLASDSTNRATVATTPPKRPVVIDLTTHWAGPLATKLSVAAGMDVVKIDPSCRPDGFRSRPGLYHHLNGSKQIVDLDLRQPQHLLEFKSMLSEADVLVESFSRRVLPNLGFSNDVLNHSFPNLSVVSIKAFPMSDPCADWLAYGGGVHAASGLAVVDGHPRPAPLPYPDFLTGLRGLRSILRASISPGSRFEETLANSVRPLLLSDSASGEGGSFGRAGQAPTADRT